MNLSFYTYIISIVNEIKFNLLTTSKQFDRLSLLTGYYHGISVDTLLTGYYHDISVDTLLTGYYHYIGGRDTLLTGYYH
jgi:hypothetical protein